jgi:hypothetical protein
MDGMGKLRAVATVSLNAAANDVGAAATQHVRAVGGEFLDALCAAHERAPPGQGAQQMLQFLASRVVPPPQPGESLEAVLARAFDGIVTQGVVRALTDTARQSLTVLHGTVSGSLKASDPAAATTAWMGGSPAAPSHAWPQQQHQQQQQQQQPGGDPRRLGFPQDASASSLQQQQQLPPQPPLPPYGAGGVMPPGGATSAAMMMGPPGNGVAAGGYGGFPAPGMGMGGMGGMGGGMVGIGGATGGGGGGGGSDMLLAAQQAQQQQAQQQQHQQAMMMMAQQQQQQHQQQLQPQMMMPPHQQQQQLGGVGGLSFLPPHQQMMTLPPQQQQQQLGTLGGALTYSGGGDPHAAAAALAAVPLPPGVMPGMGGLSALGGPDTRFRSRRSRSRDRDRDRGGAGSASSGRRGGGGGGGKTTRPPLPAAEVVGTWETDREWTWAGRVLRLVEGHDLLAAPAAGGRDLRDAWALTALARLIVFAGVYDNAARVTRSKSPTPYTPFRLPPRPGSLDEARNLLMAAVTSDAVMAYVLWLSCLADMESTARLALEEAGADERTFDAEARQHRDSVRDDRVEALRRRNTFDGFVASLRLAEIMHERDVLAVTKGVFLATEGMQLGIEGKAAVVKTPAAVVTSWISKCDTNPLYSGRDAPPTPAVLGKLQAEVADIVRRSI